MNFDKTKAMRNAERFLAEKKLSAAIDEYEQVVKHHPKDFVTMNMLGDLYIKTSAKKQAVKCFTSVAEHYREAGFSQKAIAVYNKISRLEPESFEISIKLAELYKSQGSIREARNHYKALADYYQKTGQRVEALSILKQIALLDPNDTDAFLKIAKAYLEENQPSEAVAAYNECGSRFAKLKRFPDALDCYSKALEIKNDDQAALTGFVNAKFELGAPAEAALHLRQLVERHPSDREILNLLIQCHLAAGETHQAEAVTVKLVEKEPANYPKFLELAAVYLAENDLTSTTRILTMSSEHLLVGGQAKEFNSLVRDVLARDPDHLDALRLLVRYCAWQKDEDGFRDSLVRLADIAKESGCVEDERYALSQLTMIMPHETHYIERLRSINEQLGLENEDIGQTNFDKKFFRNGGVSNGNGNGNGSGKLHGMPAVMENHEAESFVFVETNGNGRHDLGLAGDAFESSSGLPTATGFTAESPRRGNGASAADADLLKEIDSIRFYIENGYLDLADKAITDLQSEYGDRSEIKALREFWSSGGEAGPEPAAEPAAEPAPFEFVEPTTAAADEQTAASPTVGPTGEAQISASLPQGSGYDLGDLRSELGLEESESVDDSDYETHYHTAVAYQEMGLIEEAIREFQDAVGIVGPNDGTRRFFQCANLLGHCFMQQGMPKLALKWFNRTLETKGLTGDEKQALWYEVGAAYELDGDLENAVRYFEMVYAENVNFRDVRDRVKTLLVSH